MEWQRIQRGRYVSRATRIGFLMVGGGDFHIERTDDGWQLSLWRVTGGKGDLIPVDAFRTLAEAKGEARTILAEEWFREGGMVRDTVTDEVLRVERIEREWSRKPLVTTRADGTERYYHLFQVVPVNDEQEV